jgi:hypothetical protein
LNIAGVEVRQTKDGPHRGGLAGAVGTEETNHLAGGDLEGKVIQGDNVTVRSAQALEGKQTTHPFTLRLSRS